MCTSAKVDRNVTFSNASSQSEIQHLNHFLHPQTSYNTVQTESKVLFDICDNVMGLSAHALPVRRKCNATSDILVKLAEIQPEITQGGRHHVQGHLPPPSRLPLAQLHKSHQERHFRCLSGSRTMRCHRGGAHVGQPIIVRAKSHPETVGGGRNDRDTHSRESAKPL
jgi:hypothetical protein